MKIYNFFLCGLPLILRVGRKQNYGLEIFARGPYMSNLSLFRPYVKTRKKLNIFLVSGIFPGKAEGIILLGFECTINPQNLIKIAAAIFEKIKI